MNKMYMMTAIAAALLLAAGCAQDKSEQYVDEHSVTVTPTELSCDAKEQTLTLTVKADAAWQAYASDACSEWVTSVDPSYSADPQGTVTIKVAENLAKTARTGEVVIKCGTTRVKVALNQEANSPEQSDIVCPIDGYSLVWHDEFEGSSVSSKDWGFENWPWYYVNNELQYYVAGGEFDGCKTAFIEDGVLNIKAQKYTGSAKFNNTTDINGKVISARMNTKQNWTYGYFEASIWLPKGKGTWPAFWCMPKDQSLGWPACGEIDIMEEVGVDANQTSSSIHTTSYNHTKNTQKTASRNTVGAEEGFHTYALEWTADYIQTYVDGKKLLRFDNDGKNNNDTWPFAKAFYITLNLAWGGDWGGYAGVDESALPATMKVDYVRVFQK